MVYGGLEASGSGEDCFQKRTVESDDGPQGPLHEVAPMAYNSEVFDRVAPTERHPGFCDREKSSFHKGTRDP